MISTLDFRKLVLNAFMAIALIFTTLVQAHDPEMEKKRWETLIEELQLTAEQEERFRGAVKRQKEERSTLEKGIKKRLKKLKKKQGKEIADILNPDQMKSFKDFIKKKRGKKRGSDWMADDLL